MSTLLRVLMVEDSEDDALLIERELRRGGFSPMCRRVETAETMSAALIEEPWDLVISDHSMPEFSAPAALATLQRLGLDIPFVIVSGSIGEELAVEAMKAGASDFILKKSLIKLPAAIERELGDAKERRVRKETERLLREAEDRFRLLVEQIPGVTYEAEMEEVFRTTFISRQIMSLSGFPAEQWTSSPEFWANRIHPEDRERVMEERRRAKETGSSFSSTYRVLNPEGRVGWWHDSARVLPIRGGAAAILRGVVVDITEQVKAEDTIRQVAFHDRLTGLPNRTYIEHLLREEVAVARSCQGSIAVLAVRLLRFGEVTSTLGNRCGEQLVAEAARRLKECLPSSAVLSRIAPAEFSILLRGAGVDGAVEIARKIGQEGGGRPVVVEEVPLEIECQIGVALYPVHGEEAELLLQRANVALDVARRTRRPVVLYEPLSDPYSPRRLRILGELRQGLQSKQLFLQYQPKIDLKEGRVRGVEALLRWRHPKLGIVPPGDFLDAVESTAIMRPLTEWILGEALRHCRSWLREGIELPVAVNLSARNLDDPKLSDQVLGLLSSSGVPPRLLELEVTESAIISSGASPRESLERLHALGIKITIDDFGTGYSSLKHLRTFPVSALKIDRSFVGAMTANKDDEVIVRSSIDLAHNLSLAVVAEGVEDRPTWDALAAMGCDEAQGYLMARPMDEPLLKSWLAESPYGLRRRDRKRRVEVRSIDRIRV